MRWFLMKIFEVRIDPRVHVERPPSAIPDLALVRRPNGRIEVALPDAEPDNRI